MLYLTIPFGIALVAAIVLVVMVWRKMPYLRKLTPESHEVGDTVVHDLAPEAVDWLRGIPWRQYLHRTLAELEGWLTRLRTAMFALGKVSDTALKSVRRAGQQAAKSHEVAVTKLEEEKKEREQVVERDLDEVDMDDPEELKAEEQRLIVAIAQNPKDHALYSDMARVSLRLHSYQDAVEALEQAVRLEPGNEQYLKRLERAKRKRDEAAAGASVVAGK